VTDKPMTAAGQALFQHLTQLAGKPADRLLREQVLAIEAEAWKQGLEATIPPTYIDIASDAFTERLRRAMAGVKWWMRGPDTTTEQLVAAIAAAMRGEQG